MATDTPTLPARTPRGQVALAVTIAVALPIILFGAVLVLVTVSRPPVIGAFVRDVLGHDPETWPWTAAIYAGISAVLAFMILNFGAVTAAVTIWWEMRISSRMQSRIGYNRTGPGGFYQWIADAVKLLLKEDLVPAEADAILFRAAPYFVFTGFALIFVALPFGQSVIVADLNVGIFYVTAVTALIVVGILLAGWSSNSKWALFGGIRSAAQVISYEIPGGLGAMVPVLMAGTLSMQGIIRAQGAWPWQWFIFQSPFALLAFVVFFVAQLAESNRPPFDLPEAESELVAGYLAEYSAFRYALYFLVEFGNVWIMSAIAVTLFFGGWQVPFLSEQTFQAARGTGTLPHLGWWGLQALSMVVFALKTHAMMFLVMWIRWTLPRVRVDQMMSLCWKYLVPGAFVALVGALLWEILVAQVPAAALVSGVVLFLGFLATAAVFLRQTMRNIPAVGDRVDLSNW
jgi:NADH-quinone oxidoreductase subunit H